MRVRIWDKRSALFRCAVLCAAATLTTAGAHAAPFTFTLTGNLNGTIGGQPLNNDPFTWTVIGNPKAPTTLGGVLPALPAIRDTIRLGGIGTAAPTVPTFVAQSTVGSAAGFITGIVGGQTPGIAWSAPGLAVPALTRPVGPVFATFNLGVPLPTTLGTLDIANATNLIFSASGGLPPRIIAYSLHGLLSGSLGATAFTNRPFTWTLAASVEAPLTLPGPDVPALFATGDVLTISGLGALTLNDPFFAAGSPSLSAFGFVNQAADQSFVWTDAAFATYALGTPIGPLPVSFAGAQPIDTLGGQLTVTGATELTLSAQLLAVPEPGSLAVFGAGLVGLALIRRRPRPARVDRDFAWERATQPTGMGAAEQTAVAAPASQGG